MVVAGSERGMCFSSLADSIFVPRLMILDSKSVTNFGPWSHKNGIAWSLKRLLISIPWLVIPDPRAVIPDPSFWFLIPPLSSGWSHIPCYDPVVESCLTQASSSFFFQLGSERIRTVQLPADHQALLPWLVRKSPFQVPGACVEVHPPYYLLLIWLLSLLHLWMFQHWELPPLLPGLPTTAGQELLKHKAINYTLNFSLWVHAF